jgi:predicted MFS family arabinose efflux permease
MKPSDEVTLDRSRITALALGLSRYAPRGATLVAGVLLIEIGATFGLPVGVANQLNATHSLLSLLTALAMGVLSIKFSMESLLYVGIGLSMVSAVGCLLAPSFQALFLFYSLNGIAWSLIYPMSVALIGELIPQERRADAMSKLFAVPPIITVFGSPLIGYIGDWRRALLLYAIPIAVASLILVRLSIPLRKTTGRKVELASAFRILIANRSAMTCLIYFLLNSVTWQIVGVLSISFLREHHHLSKAFTSLIYSGFAIAVFVGALSGGRIVNIYGRKSSTVFITLVYGVTAILFVLSPNAYLAAGLGILTCLLVGLRQPAINSLTVEQIPEIRGSIMSLSAASGNVGGMIGAAIAGFLLLNYGWITAGVSLGSAAILAGILLHIFAKDPTTHRKQYSTAPR